MSTDTPPSSPCINPIIWHDALSGNPTASKHFFQSIPDFNFLATPAQAPITKRGRPSNDSMWGAYWEALSQYCYVLGINPQFVLLKNPFLYFYTKNGNVYFIYPFQILVPKNGTVVQQRITQLTPESWPTFLSLIGLWRYPWAGVDELYRQLTLLLVKYRLSELDTRFQQIRVYNTLLADRLNELYLRTTITPSGMLLLQTDYPPYQYRPWSAALLLEQIPLLRSMGSGSAPLRQLLTPYFNALSKKLRSNIRAASHRPKGRPRKGATTHLIYQINDRMYQITSPAAPIEKGHFEIVEGDFSLCGEKYFRVSSVWCDAPPPDAGALLSFITGNSVELLDELCKLFYRIMTANPKADRISVLYAPQSDSALRNLFGLLFDNGIPSYPYPKGKVAISLNTLTQQKHLWELAEQTALGRTLVMLQDAVPNSDAIAISDALKVGKVVTLTDPYFTGQCFKNRVSLLCITSKKEKATAMCGRLAIPLVTLNTGENPVSTEIPLSVDGRSWLLTALPIRGMYLSHGVKAPKAAHLELPSSTDIDLERFFLTCCCVGDRIPAIDLYDAYREYYAVLHSNPYQNTQKMFTKEVISNLEDCKKFPGFTKHKLWSQTRGACAHFTGLVLKPNWREYLPPSSFENIPDEFLNALWNMHTNIPNQLTRPGVPDGYDDETEQI